MAFVVLDVEENKQANIFFIMEYKDYFEKTNAREDITKGEHEWTLSINYFGTTELLWRIKGWEIQRHMVNTDTEVYVCLQKSISWA